MGRNFYHLLQWAVPECMSAPSSTLLPAFTVAIKRRDFVVPAYPAAAFRLRRLMASDNYGVPQISEAVSSDPALAATVLRLANSPLYRPNGPPITALCRAIHRIGVRSLSTIATASGVGAQACARSPLLDLKYAVWRRAVTCALICQKLGPAVAEQWELPSELAAAIGASSNEAPSLQASCSWPKNSRIRSNKITPRKALV